MKHVITISLICFCLTACSEKKSEKSVTAPEVEKVAVESATVLSSGVFEGRSDHVTTGGVTLKKDGDQFFLILEEDFSLDGAPAPTLGFGNGAFVAESEFSALRRNTGMQTYKLPDDFDPSDYSEVYLWCSEFSVPLGIAALSTGE